MDVTTRVSPRHNHKFQGGGGFLEEERYEIPVVAAAAASINFTRG